MTAVSLEKYKQTDLKFLKVVEQPVQLPSIRRRDGVYARVLQQASGLEPTNIESGLSPHLEWSVKDKKESRKVLASLYASKRRSLASTRGEEKERLRKISFTSRQVGNEGKHIIYIWREG